jgi:hypothetical protein
MHGRGEKSHKVLEGKPKGKRPLRIPKHRWKDGIKLDLGEIGKVWDGVEWIQFAQDRDWWQALVNMVMNLQVLAPWI